MYTEFYNLTGRPFQLTPDPRFYYDTRTHRKAMAYLTYGLNQGEGFIIITGDVGAGKTTLVGHLFDAIEGSEYVVANVVTTQLDADSTLRMVATAFSLKVEDCDKAEILRRIEQFLRAHHAAGRRVLLTIDEAQNLPVSALEELRMLSNFQDGNKALLQTFLLGQPEFRDKLALSPELEQLRQRVIATHHLEPMQEEELPEYVLHRLSLCGWQNDPMFTDDAFKLMFDYSGGVPRRLNNLCSRILLFGALEETHVIDAGLVRQVIDDLRQDNTPTTGPKHMLDADTAYSSIGPMYARVPPKVQRDRMLAEPGLPDPDIMRRLDILERYVRSHDRSIRQLVRILSEWADETDEAADALPTGEAQP